MGLLSAVRSTVLPAKGTTPNQNARADDYGNLFVNQGVPAGLTAALEGSLFVARATPAVGGVGVAMSVQTTLVDTNAAAVLINNEVVGGKTYLPVYVRGRITAPGASSTSAEVAVQVDNTNRYTSGGTALGNIANVNAGASVPSTVATAFTGACLCAAAGARRRYVGSAILKIAATPLWLVNDVFLVTFGAPGQFVHQAPIVASDAAAPVTTSHVPLAGCAIPPAGSMIIQIANIANAATPPSIEFELGWIER